MGFGQHLREHTLAGGLQLRVLLEHLLGLRLVLEDRRVLVEVRYVGLAVDGHRRHENVVADGVA
jgi:cytochrome c-type biogenesis protein CcmE